MVERRLYMANAGVQFSNEVPNMLHLIRVTSLFLLKLTLVVPFLMFIQRRVGRAVMYRIANPKSPVRLRGATPLNEDLCLH